MATALGVAPIHSNVYVRSASGNITQDQSPTRTRNYSYDGAGRLVKTVQGTLTRNYSYDQNTNRCGALTCDGSFLYDSADRILSSPYASSYTYDPHGNVTEAALTDQPPPISRQEDFSFDTLSGTENFEVWAGDSGQLRTQLDWDPYLDASGNPVYATVELAIEDDAGNTLAADAVNRPKDLLVNVTPGRYVVKVTPLLGEGTAHLVITHPDYPRELLIAYDANDHATSIHDGRLTITETLSPEGRVIERKVANPLTGETLEHTLLGYDSGGDSPAYTLPAAGGSPTTYVTGPAGLLATITGSTASYQVSNGGGHLVGEVKDGSFTAFAEADEFGVGEAPEGRLGYLGNHERYSLGDGSGLIRMGVRLYDPALGRFLQVDPVEGGSANDYEYCYGDSINCLDLFGEFAVAGALGAGWAIGGSNFWNPVGWVVLAAAAIATIGWAGWKLHKWAKEHRKGARKSTRGKHQHGTKRKGMKHKEKKRLKDSWRQKGEKRFVSPAYFYGRYQVGSTWVM